MDTQKFLVGAEWRESANQAEVIDPYTGKAIAQVFQATANDIDAAIVTAQKALPEIAKLPGVQPLGDTTPCCGENKKRARCNRKRDRRTSRQAHAVFARRG